MPFTFSHPAIVLPLTWLPRKWFSLTGLIVGSVTPDFEYFIRMTDKSHFSHTIAGLFWFDLPLAIILAFIFHSIVRNSLINNLPVILKSRLSQFNEYNWGKDFKKNWFVITMSILIGAASHIFWDSFTHYHAFFVNAIPALQNKVEIAGWRIPVYHILQDVSSVIGGLVVAFALLQLRADKTITGSITFKYWSIVVSLSLAIIAARLLNGLDFKLSWDLVMTVISAGLIALILTPLLIRPQHNQP